MKYYKFFFNKKYEYILLIINYIYLLIFIQFIFINHLCMEIEFIWNKRTLFI